MHVNKWPRFAIGAGVATFFLAMAAFLFADTVGSAIALSLTAAAAVGYAVLAHDQLVQQRSVAAEERAQFHSQMERQAEDSAFTREIVRRNEQISVRGRLAARMPSLLIAPGQVEIYFRLPSADSTISDQWTSRNDSMAWLPDQDRNSATRVHGSFSFTVFGTEPLNVFLPSAAATYDELITIG